MKIPYRETFKLKRKLESVECWNFSGDDRYDIPKGRMVRLDNSGSATETVVTVLDRNGNSVGIPCLRTGGAWQQGYRFIVDNQVLGKAIGIKMPKTTPDLVGDIIAYETGEATPKQAAKLMRDLKKSGIGKRLQGHYSSKM
jgi:hypothetical protein